jgi:SAM-dependent methyltransferase
MAVKHDKTTTSSAPAGAGDQAHWDHIYDSKDPTEVSWYEAQPTRSLQLIRASGITPAAAIVEVGAGTSLLVDELLAAGFRDLTLLDISAVALRRVRERLGSRAASVNLLHQDVTTFKPAPRYALWHDRAVFHFLVEVSERRRYLEVVRQALRPGGQLIIATFGPQGPERCSGLPIRRYDAATLAAELGGEFTLAESSLALHSTPWGAAQQFLYCRFERRGSSKGNPGATA